MTWVAIITALIQLFGPVLVEWLQDIFKRLESDQQVQSVDAVFDAAYAELGWFNFRKKAVLGIYRRHALRHNEALIGAAKGQAVALTLNTKEVAELTKALAA